MIGVVGSPSVDRVMLINTPTHDYASFGHFEAAHTPPLGLLSLATSLRSAGLDAEVLDAEYQQLGLEEAVARVVDSEAQVVGLNTFSVNISIAQDWASALAATGKTVVLGGPHVNLISTSSLKRDFPDIKWAIRGDAEVAITHFVQGEPGDAHGLVDLKTGVEKPPIYAPTVHQPVIDRSLSLGEPTIRTGKRWFATITTRGCTFRCAFCAGCSVTSGQPYRIVPHETVAAELASLSELDPDGIRLVDDLPFRSMRYAYAFLEMAKRYVPGVEWSFNMPLAYLKVLAEGDWRRLADLGLREVSFGVESGDAVRRRTLGKNASKDQIRATVDSALSAGISAKTYFIIGTPGETAHETMSTIALAQELTSRRVDGPESRCSMFAFKPMPGSAYWDTLRNTGFSEQELLSYCDFHLQSKPHQKHSWRSKLAFGEIRTDEIERLIDDYYKVYDCPFPDA